MTVKSNKYTIDVSAKTLGRVSTEIAMILMGKNSPDYVPNIDNDNKVIIININQMKFSSPAKKMDQKKYRHYSGYPSGMKTRTLGEMIDRDPKKVLVAAVSRMLPKNKLQNERLKRISFKK